MLARRSQSSAFTLLELVVVMAIIAVIVAMTVPKLGNFARTGRSIGDSADQVVILSRWARTQAISRGINFRLNFDPSQKAYWLTMQSGPSFENLLQVDPTVTPTQNTTQFDQVGEEYGRRFTAPDDISLTCNVPQQQDGQYVEFRPSGRCDPASVTFSDPSGSVIEVGCLAATEQWHVLSDDERQQEQNAQPPPPAQTR